MKLHIVGNCQTVELKDIINLIGDGVSITHTHTNSVTDGFDPNFDHFDWVIVQNHARLSALFKHRGNPKFVFSPNFIFTGYFADLFYMKAELDELRLRPHSNLVTNAFIHGLSKEECASLFTREFISKLDYGKRYDTAKQWFINHLNSCGLDGAFLFAKWDSGDPFMMTTEHPETWVLADTAKLLCRRIGLPIKDIDVSRFYNNRMRLGSIFPVYNGKSNALTSADQHYKIDGKVLSLKDFVERTYHFLHQEFANSTLEEKLQKASEERYRVFEAAYENYRTSGQPSAQNPYRNLPNTSFWRPSVEAADKSTLTPLTEQVTPVVGPASKVATAGSCFAQHIARTLSSRGLNYFVAEPAPEGTSAEEADLKGYGLFSARFGNIYTARQLLQLFKRAYAQFEPQEKVWASKTDGYIDPFRPNIGESFETEEAALNSQKEHLASVRRMFEELDVFVFTLGLTESWVNSADGSVYPVAPGVVSSHAQYEAYEFKNFSKNEVYKDMLEFLEALRRVNRSAKVLLTVSPVPLIATYEKEHVLTATTYSKSVLRVVASELANEFDFVTYFPSYEIISSAYNRGAYFAEDLRSVTDKGVEHVMGVFMRTVVDSESIPEPGRPTSDDVPEQKLIDEIEKSAEVVCDEELVVAAL